MLAIAVVDQSMPWSRICRGCLDGWEKRKLLLQAMKRRLICPFADEV